jgi:PAS domain S-box-containing protein
MEILVEANFGAILDAAPDAMLVVDQHGRIVHANVQSELLFGYAPSELLGQKIELLVPPRFRSKHPGHRSGYFGDPHVRPWERASSFTDCARTEQSFPLRSA